MHATCHAVEGLCIQYCEHSFLFDNRFAIVLGCKFPDICNSETGTRHYFHQGHFSLHFINSTSPKHLEPITIFAIYDQYGNCI